MKVFKLVFALELFFASIFADVRDIHIVTIPKSGTHLATKLIFLLQRESGILVRNSVSHFYFEHPLSRFDQSLNDSELKTVIFTRDLRDVVVSLVHAMEKFERTRTFISNDQDRMQYEKFQYFEDKLTYVLTPGNSCHNLIVKNCEGYLKALQDPYVLRLCFEDLVGSKGGGSNERQRNAIIKLIDFASMQLSDESIAKIQTELFGSSTTFRKGQIGIWREEFTTEHEALFEQFLGSMNRQMGY